MIFISLQQARLHKTTHYFTGLKCIRGHIAPRIVSSRACVECAKENNKISNPKRAKYFSEYQKINKDKCLAATRKYNATHKEERRLYDREMRKNDGHKAKKAAYERARRARKRAGGGQKITKKDIDSLLKLQNNKCASCRLVVSSYHVDHIMPIKLGGECSLANLQILCVACNLKKGAKDPIKWASENWRLL